MPIKSMPHFVGLSVTGPLSEDQLFERADSAEEFQRKRRAWQRLLAIVQPMPREVWQTESKEGQSTRREIVVQWPDNATMLAFIAALP